MKRFFASSTAALAALLILQGALFSQNKKGDKAAGFGLGAQQQYNDFPVTPTRFGGEGFFRYGLSDRFNLNFIAGFAPTATVYQPPAPAPSKTVGTSIIYADLAADFTLMKGRFRPFL
jgi:hypothetical protein